MEEVFEAKGEYDEEENWYLHFVEEHEDKREGFEEFGIEYLNSNKEHKEKRGYDEIHCKEEEWNINIKGKHFEANINKGKEWRWNYEEV